MVTPRNPQWSRSTLFGAILFFGLLAMTARPATDPDLGWHLRTGQWIIETGHVPHTDPFSFTRGGSAWISHEWLSEVIFYGLWKLGGAAALIVFSALVTTLGFLFLYWRCLYSHPPAAPHWAAGVTILGAWASAPCWGTRPQMFTFLLASIFLFLLERGESRPRLLLWIPPLLLLWLNLHAGFALGLVLMFLYAAGLGLEAAFGSTTWREARPMVVRVLLAMLVCLALVPLNPMGARLYLYSLETVRAVELRSLIVEWFSPDFHQWLYFPYLLVILLLMTVFAWSRLAIKGRVLMPLSFIFLSSLDAVRHIPIFMLLAIPVLAQALPHSSSSGISTRRWKPRPAAKRFRPLFRWTAVALLAIFAVSRWITLAHTQSLRAAEQYPSKAVAFLRENTPPEPGRLFAYYDWGGYAIWNLYPQYRLFVDGRSDLYGDEILKECQTSMGLRNGWRQILDRWQVETVLIPPDSALAQALLLDPGWSSPYHDAQADVFVRIRRK
jgi:hypothetical protein